MHTRSDAGRVQLVLHAVAERGVALRGMRVARAAITVGLPETRGGHAVEFGHQPARATCWAYLMFPCPCPPKPSLPTLTACCRGSP